MKMLLEITIHLNLSIVCVDVESVQCAAVVMRKSWFQTHVSWLQARDACWSTSAALSASLTHRLTGWLVTEFVRISEDNNSS